MPFLKLLGSMEFGYSVLYVSYSFSVEGNAVCTLTLGSGAPGTEIRALPGQLPRKLTPSSQPQYKVHCSVRGRDIPPAWASLIKAVSFSPNFFLLKFPNYIKGNDQYNKNNPQTSQLDVSVIHIFLLFFYILLLNYCKQGADTVTLHLYGPYHVSPKCKDVTTELLSYSTK